MAEKRAAEQVSRAVARVSKAEEAYNRWEQLVLASTGAEDRAFFVGELDKARVEIQNAYAFYKESNVFYKAAVENEEKSSKIPRISLEEIRNELKLELQRGFQDLVAKQGGWTSLSSAGLGKKELARLRKYGLVVIAADTGSGDPFWTMEDQAAANLITSEAKFDVFITKFFNKALKECGMVFVNSERYSWIPQLEDNRTQLKPDGFATLPGMYIRKPPPNENVNRPKGEFLFGVAVKELFDSVIIFESKLKIQDSSFGQVVLYLCHLNKEGSSGAVLFDPQDFWLITCHKGIVNKVVQAKWIARGSASLFQDFMEQNQSPWMRRFTEASISFGVEALESNAFLGCGAHGRVFKVRRGEQTYALKLVEERSCGVLFDESRALTKATDKDLTVSVAEKATKISDGAALLLSPVGTHLSQPETQEDVRKLFELLWKLHENGLIHGDPRVPNVIVYQEKILWIDLIHMREDSEVYFRQCDAEILSRSILRIPHTFSLDSELLKLIELYANDHKQENLECVITKVCQILQI
jgi:tRNA A-37 threonylcarbamoyl transferase component Bud32